jgi:hypothetical protein
MAAVRQAGRQGEAAARIIPNTNRIPSLTGTSSYRVPDVLNSTTIGEVKNVASQSYTSQLRDDVLYAQKYGLTFELTVRRTTELSGPLAEAVSRGEIILNFLP